jgi:hypothetical protein
MRPTPILLLVAAAVVVSACGISQRATLGAQCDLSSECEAPLVCRLERCRRQCVTSRDCGLGLRCLKAQDGLGVCQLPEETSCILNSDCPESLVCPMMTECTNACVQDRDCPPGSYCDEPEGQPPACVEVATERCVYHSDCPEPFVCKEELCTIECADNRDCGDGRVCVWHDGCPPRQGPCICRHACDLSPSCPNLGTECVDCPATGDCGVQPDPSGANVPVTRYCERESR